MSHKARIFRLERRIEKPPCECESASKRCHVIYPDEAKPEDVQCPKCGRSKTLIVVKYFEEGMWSSL